MTTSEKRRMCSGCRDEFYHNRDGMCWSFDDAKVVVKKEVSVDQRPPWTQKARKFLSCFRRQRYVYVGKDVVR